jgi:hypothetical protein
VGNNMSRFRGIGRVFKNGHEVARVHYALTTTREFLSTASRTAGFVRPVRGKIEVGEHYVLRLETGGEVEFFARYTNGIDHPHSTYSVTVNGDPEG